MEKRWFAHLQLSSYLVWSQSDKEYALLLVRFEYIALLVEVGVVMRTFIVLCSYSLWQALRLPSIRLRTLWWSKYRNGSDIDWLVVSSQIERWESSFRMTWLNIDDLTFSQYRYGNEWQSANLGRDCFTKYEGNAIQIRRIAVHQSRSIDWYRQPYKAFENTRPCGSNH